MGGAVALGIAGVIQVGPALVPFLVVGPLLVVGYNFELFGGVIHNDVGFAASWGAFPVLTAYVAQTGRLALAPLIAAAGAFALSVAQRALSTPARLLRRRATDVSGAIVLVDGQSIPVERAVLLAPLEQALRAMSWAIVMLAAALARWPGWGSESEAPRSRRRNPATVISTTRSCPHCRTGRPMRLASLMAGWHISTVHAASTRVPPPSGRNRRWASPTRSPLMVASMASGRGHSPSSAWIRMR